MSMREQQAHAVRAQRDLFRHAEVATHQIVIAVDVEILLATKARGEFGVCRFGGVELAGLIARQRSRQRFPNVAEQYDVLEIDLEKREEAQEVGVVVAESVGEPAATEM